MLRECARVLAEDRKRVVIVDTSNEIAGDGDVPHPGIGHSRRMPVADPHLQHNVMIEAVENHMPQVIVIDEMGTEAEAFAARTIAERGVQLIGTAHGQTLENLLMNPTLSDLIGGISAVTLSDEEARRRGTRKTVLERKAPPTFDVVVEIQDRDRLAIHQNVGEVVDALLRGYQPQPEVRQRTAGGAIDILQQANPEAIPDKVRALPQQSRDDEMALFGAAGESIPDDAKPLMIFPYGVSRNKIERAVHNLRVNASIARKWDDADVVLTLKTLERKESDRLKQIAAENVPIYSIKTNTTTQIQNALKDVFNLPVARRRRDRPARGRGSGLPGAARQPSHRALAADVVPAPDPASAGREVPAAVAQHRPRAQPPRPDLQRTRPASDWAQVSSFTTSGVVDRHRGVELQELAVVEAPAVHGEAMNARARVPGV